MNIRARFWAGLVVMVLLFVFFGAYSVVSAHRALVAAKEAEMVGLAVALADSIEYRIEEQVYFLEYLQRQQFAVVRDLSGANAGGPENDFDRRNALEREWKGGGAVVAAAKSAEVSKRLRGLLGFLEARQGFPVFTELFVTDVHGRVVGMTGLTSDYFQDDEEWWLDAMRFGAVAESLEFDESSGTYGLLVAVRLDDESGRPLGVAKGVLNLAEIIRRVQKDKLNSDADLMLFDSSGRLLFSSRSGFDSFGDLQVGSSLMRNAAGSMGFFKVEGEAELPYVAYHKLTAEKAGGKWFSWTFMMRAGGDAIFAQVNQAMMSVVFFLILIVGVVFVLGAFMSRRVALPIEELASVLEKTSTGAEASEIDSSLKDRKDEIGRLARSFDRMLYSLRMAVRRGPPKGEAV